MPAQKNLKEKIQRLEQALTLKPQLGRHTNVSTTKLTNGLACEVQEGPWTLHAAMPEAAGGPGDAPTPGVLGRAALGSCLAFAYMMWATKLGVPVETFEIEVHTDIDDGGLVGSSEVLPGYSQVRFVVRVISDANEEQIKDVLDTADEHSPWLDNYTRALTCVRQIEIVPASTA